MQPSGAGTRKVRQELEELHDGDQIVRKPEDGILGINEMKPESMKYDGIEF